MIAVQQAIGADGGRAWIAFVMDPEFRADVDARRTAGRTNWTDVERERFFRIAIRHGLLSDEKIEQLLHDPQLRMGRERWSNINDSNFWSRLIGEYFVRVADARRQGLTDWHVSQHIARICIDDGAAMEQRRVEAAETRQQSTTKNARRQRRDDQND